jgi:hypothetical protein
MKYLLAIIALKTTFCHPTGTYAQSMDLGGTTTRAVVVGISDYREPLIPDLKYADRDARAFAQWLRSPEGGNLPDSNLVLLENAGATNAQMIVSLDWLIEASKPGDRAFIYFSGHGDVERVTKFSLGYLLGHDSPSAVYGAGAFSLNYLQAIISTLSEKEVQVIVITDACHAGKLAGSSVNGTKVTSMQLAQQFANEIKIMSCQPEEYSLEGEQWGGGRGCFSYHLEDALYGLADGNADATVDLRELRRYLEDHVSAEAAPQSQVPLVSGPVQVRLASVNNNALAARKATRKNSSVPFMNIENKGMESRFLEEADTTVQRLYAQFLVALDSGHLLQPTGRSANDYFRSLLERPDAAALAGTMKRKLAAALIEEGQTIINKVLQTDPQVLDNIWANRVNYDHLPAYFERAAEILGEKHYVWRDLKAKEYYFRAMTIRQENYPDSSAEWQTSEKRRLLEKSLEWDSTAAVVYYQLGKTFQPQILERVSYYKKAASFSPNWALIHCELGFVFGVENKEQLLSIYHYKRAIELDSNFLRPYNWISWSFDDIGQKDSAEYWRTRYVEKILQKMKSDSASIKAFEYNDVGNALWRLRDYEKAKAFLLSGEKIAEGKMSGIYGNLYAVYTDLLDWGNAIYYCEKVASRNKFAYNAAGTIYFFFMNNQEAAANAYSRAEDKFDARQVQFNILTDNLLVAFAQSKLVIESNSNDYRYYYFAAESARHLGMVDTARQYLNLILEKVKIEYEPNFFSPTWRGYMLVALALDRLGMKSEFQQLMDTATLRLKDNVMFNFDLACIYAQANQEKAAIASLQKAIELGWQPYPLIWLTGTLCDPLLNPIRETDGFKALVKKHFPKYYDIATRIPGKH